MTLTFPLLSFRSRGEDSGKLQEVPQSGRAGLPVAGDDPGGR